MLRDAALSDLKFVYDLYMDETVNPFTAYDPMPLSEFEPIFGELLEETQLLLWEFEGKTLGMVQIQRGIHRFTHSAHLGGIAISPQRQNEGLGTRLMREVLEILEKEKLVRVELCVSADNPRGIAFYEKLGFEIEGTMKQYFSRAGREEFFDEHIMAKFLC